MDPIRGAAVTAMAASPGVFAQQTGQGAKAMAFYEKGPVRIHYEESGSGFPLVAHSRRGIEWCDYGVTHTAL